MIQARAVLSAAAGAAFLLVPAMAAQAQGFTDAVTMEDAIKGTMTIDFQTRLQFDTTGDVPEGSPALGVTDTYNADLEVMSSVLVQGTVQRLPWLPSSFLGRTYQVGMLEYDLDWTLRNPSNPAQTVRLGGWVGALTMDGEGIYHLAEPPEGKGKLRVSTDAVGNIAGFVSEFGGEIQGRAPEQAGLLGFADRASRQVTRTYSRVVDGQIVEHTVEGADPMAFTAVMLAQGPLAGYPQSTLNGTIDYDPEEGVWYVDVDAAYTIQGAAMVDRYSGTIRWNEDPNRASNGLGAYDVNVRVNEPEVTEAAAFPTVANAEDAFFAAVATVPGFTGQISYADKIAEESVIASSVTYAVDGNSITKIQAMNFAKILLLMVGPFNDE